jgi:hypothetical protein
MSDARDPLTVQSAACSEIAEEPAIGCRMAGTDLEDAPARELHADDVVTEDARVANTDHGDRHDGFVHHAVDEPELEEQAIAVPKSSERTVHPPALQVPEARLMLTTQATREPSREPIFSGTYSPPCGSACATEGVRWTAIEVRWAPEALRARACALLCFAESLLDARLHFILVVPPLLAVACGGSTSSNSRDAGSTGGVGQ